MSDSRRLLELIEEGIAQHQGDLDGWTMLDEDQLELFDGRATLTAHLLDEPHQDRRQVHAHVVTKLADYDNEELDACLYGLGDSREEALEQAAMIWITLVAGPIISFLDNKPVGLTCQAGVMDGDIEQGYSPDDFGMKNVRAYVGATFARGFDDDSFEEEITGSKPWFLYATESAAPRRVHLAKSTVFSEGKQGWRRELEIDGHEVSHSDPTWPADKPGPQFGYFTRFAVFEFPQNSTAVDERARLDRTILHFALNYGDYPDVDQLIDAMQEDGFDAEVVQEVESVSTLAFGRVFFEGYGASYSPYIIRAHADGSVETKVPLMSIPAYSRARALAPKIADMLSQEEFQELCFYSAESDGILQMLADNESDEIDLSGACFYPCIVPDRDVDDSTMQLAWAKLKQFQAKERIHTLQKPWWKFW
ncbi:hypothetical protein [Aeoliella mucimassa]|uniref:Uncharacterized protein n=1 Tax=Aeoliella mucimassa TaxID=2527972 RepID=A0A518ARG5_9BACT|nr:hypothetical protein [Aeoliella mucimassa]QDU57312.1 hypothetical protein Pan181_35270 [Aeoliella mucimassa]